MDHACAAESQALTIALGQMNLELARPDVNLARARRIASDAKAAGADVLVLPELWLHGYDLQHAEKHASKLGSGGFAEMSALARDFRLYVAGSLFEKREGGVSNTAVLCNRQGDLLGSYRKIHLFRPMHEDQSLLPGTHATACSTEWGLFGLAICYDIRFPEMIRSLALAGAVVILVPAQWPARRSEAWLLLTSARAVENELFVAACNRVDSSDPGAFPGQSRVVDPWGTVLAEGNDQESIVVAHVDLREVRKARRYITVFEDRRPTAYHVQVAATPVQSRE
jgi:omega-amidase